MFQLFKLRYVLIWLGKDHHILTMSIEIVQHFKTHQKIKHQSSTGHLMARVQVLLYIVTKIICFGADIKYLRTQKILNLGA